MPAGVKYLSEDDLRKLIDKICKETKFEFSPHSKAEILKYSGKWSENHTDFFESALNRIINKEKSYPDKKNKRCSVMPYPISLEKSMAIFFLPRQNDESYLIYDFQIVERDAKEYNSR